MVTVSGGLHLLQREFSDIPQLHWPVVLKSLESDVGALPIWNVTVTPCCLVSVEGPATVDAVATREVTKTESRLAARCAAIASVGASVIPFRGHPDARAGLAALGVFSRYWPASS